MLSRVQLNDIFSKLAEDTEVIPFNDGFPEEFSEDFDAPTPYEEDVPQYTAEDDFYEEDAKENPVMFEPMVGDFDDDWAEEEYWPEVEDEESFINPDGRIDYGY